MSLKSIQRLLFVVLLGTHSWGYCESIRDYYSEPAINPFKESLNQNFNEHIDPFSGGVSLSYVDLKIPGDGGLDIVVNRTYNSVQDNVGPRTVNGIGWSMHFGRIVVSSSHADKICAQQLWSVEVLNNPSLERPDGGREILFLADDPDAYLITRSRWKAECGGASGLVVTSPDGTVYVMDQFENNGSEVSWYASSIEDTNGNRIGITYKTAGGFTYIDEVTATDGRVLQFNYEFDGTSSVRLSSIVANNQTWEYKYTNVPELGGSYEQLTEVVRPDNQNWLYEYYPLLGGAGEAGDFSLKRVTYPYGATIDYTYKYVYFDPVDTLSATTVVAQKTVGGVNVDPGVWTFDYVPATTRNSALDRTTVTTPNGKHLYYHFGYSGNFIGTVWKVGLLRAHEIYDNTDALLHQEINDWGSQQISTENYRHGRSAGKADTNTVTPLILTKTVWRDSALYVTEYSGYDAYGNPGQVVETGSYTGDETRTSTFTYYTDPAEWIIGIPQDETIAGIGTISRTFDIAGNMLNETKYGVSTDYTYHPAGDMHTVTDARGNTTQYLDYFRGIPRSEIHPVDSTNNITVSRTVNLTGTVETATNGRGKTTSYQYDLLNRITSITKPVNAPVSISYTPTGSLLTRLDYEKESLLDGFGREICVQHRDTLDNQLILQQTRFDVMGNQVFSSIPASTGTCGSPLNGVTTAYDTLNRVTRIDNPDTTFVSWTYMDNHIVKVTDERSKDTLYQYRSFGDPDQKDLMIISEPHNIATNITRDALGNILSVVQDEVGQLGYARRYGYDSQLFLTSVSNPETGVTVYGRDAVGNMLSKKVGASDTTQYTYDWSNRLSYINYPGSAPDVEVIYDDNNNVLSKTSGTVVRSYIYDDNDNLTSETLGIGLNDYTVGYTFNAYDVVDVLTYPGGRTVSYSPNAFGFPTKASPYIKTASYHPSGHLASIEYNNGITTDYALNPDRLWVERIHGSARRDEILDLNYTYDAVGNVKTISDAVQPSNQYSFGFDDINRLVTADGPWGTGILSYSATGNIESKDIGGDLNQYAYWNNRLVQTLRNGYVVLDWRHDDYGNVIGNQMVDYVYDDASHLIEGYVFGGLTASYLYDGDGERVQQVRQSEITGFLTASNGNLLYETSNDGAQTKEHIYIGSMRIATVDTNLVPRADAGQDATITEQAAIILLGTAHDIPRKVVPTYDWRRAPGSNGGDLQWVDTTSVRFTAPAVVQPTDFRFIFTVTTSAGTDTDSVTVTVMPLDTDADGLSDVWENQRFGNLAPLPNDDPDGDGYTNLTEMLNGTNPLVAQAPAAVSAVQVSAGNRENTIEWTPVEQATTYHLYWGTSPDITVATATQVANVNSPYVHTGLTNGQAYYYFVTAANAVESAPSQTASGIPGFGSWSAPANLTGNTFQYATIVDVLHGDGGQTAAIVKGTPAGGGNHQYWLYYRDASGQWHDPQILAFNRVDDQAIDAAGNVAMVGRFGGSSYVTGLQSYSPSSGLSTAQTVGAYNNDAASIMLESSGNGLVFYNYNGGNGTTVRTFSTAGGLGADIQNPGMDGLPVCSASNDNGQYYIGWKSQSPKAYYVTRYDTATGWSSAEFMAFLTAGKCDIDVLASGNAVFAWDYDGRFRRRIYENGAWSYSQPVDINQSPSRVINVASASANLIDLSWSERRYGGSEIYWQTFLQPYYDGIGWAGVEQIPTQEEQIGELLSAANGTKWLASTDPRYFYYRTAELDWQRLDVAPAAALTSDFDANSQGNAAFGWRESNGNGTQSVWLQVFNNPQVTGKPIASAGNDQLVAEGASITLDGSASSDTDGSLVTYQWRQIYGVGVTLSSANTAVAGFTLPLDMEDTVLGFELLVTDNDGLRDVDIVAVTVDGSNASPVANAGQDRIEEGVYNVWTMDVALDGNASLDPDGSLTAYSWRQVDGFRSSTAQFKDGAGGLSSTSNLAAPTIQLHYDCGGELSLAEDEPRTVLELSVTDDKGAVATDLITIGVNCAPPTANAGTNFTVDEDTGFSVSGAQSSDSFPGYIAQYRWRQISGPSAQPDYTIGGYSSGDPAWWGNSNIGFIAPSVSATSSMTFELEVTDNKGATDTATLQITVRDKVPPLAAAGSDQIVDEGASVYLNGTGSSDPNGTIAAYSWVQTAGPTVVGLTGETTVTPNFTAPLVTTDSVVTFELTVTDDQDLTAADTVDILVKDLAVSNTPPTANAGTDQTVDEDVVVNLNGSASTDSDGSIVSYSWIQTAGPAVTLSGATTATPSYTAPSVSADTLFTFELTVTDDGGASATDSVSVTVQNVPIGPDTMPPVTTANLVRGAVKGVAYFDITLSADEPATTYYQVTGQGTITSGGIDTTALQTYTGPIHVNIAKRGTAYLDYYSVDSAGNIEATQTEVLK